MFPNKKFRGSFLAQGLLLTSLAVPACASAQSQSTPASTTAPDNTAHNKAHRVTADQQTNGASDRETTAKIRRAIIADKSLSMYGHNVKIVTRNGAVTLKGPVHSDEEKKTIASKAEEVAGQGKVTDQLTVKQ